LGFLDDPAATEAVYAAIGSRLARAGVTLNLAPVADVNVNPRNPVIGVRSFSASPEVAARQVAAAVQGLQGAGVAACPKHFPGHGATSSDSHHEVATVTRSRAELDAAELVPFRAGIAAGARAVMTGHLLVPALDPSEIATVSRTITTQLLRDELGFTGTVVTDALEMQAVSATIGIPEGFVQALIAGADAIETGAQDAEHLIDAIVAAVATAVADGRLDIARLEDAARRTAQLASPGDAGRSVEAPDVAARCLEIRGPLPRLDRPLVVECRSPNGVATGELPWSLADAIAEREPGTETVLVDGPAPPIEADGRSLVVVVRDPNRHPWQHAVLDAARRHPNSVIVDAGWPAEDLPEPYIRTRGIAPGLLDAAAEALAAPDRATFGRLTRPNVARSENNRPRLHELPAEEVVGLLLDGEQRVVPAVRAATDQIVAAARLIADRLRDGGRLAFAGAGTSGRVAFTEAAELPGTFGLAEHRIVAIMAGGADGTDWHEDDTEMAQRDLDRLAPTSGDVLVAVAASGSTPYTIELAEGAAKRGADVVAMVNTPGSPLSLLANLAIEVPVGPEVLRGSTRLSAGSAQKVTLNALTTTAMTLLGRVHGDVMVDVVPANAKLRERAAGIAAEIAGSSIVDARAALAACDWNTRAAVLCLVADLDPAEAIARAAQHATLQAALNSVG
jgi:beta-N-acetylhexosaminidase